MRRVGRWVVMWGLCWAGVGLSQEVEPLPIVDYRVVREYRVAGVRVEGNGEVDTAFVVALTGLVPGTTVEIPGERIKRAVELLWKQGIYEKVDILVERVEGKDVWLVVRLVRSAALASFTVKGVSRADAEELASSLKSVKGKIFTQATVNTIRQTVRQYYVKKGYLFADARVDTTMVADQKGVRSVNATIKIERGPRVRVEDIEFYGNHHISHGQLYRQCKNTRKYTRLRILEGWSWRALICGGDSPCSSLRWLWYPLPTVKSIARYLSERSVVTVFKSSKYVPEKWQEDKERIINFYYSRGFRNARVVWDSVVFTPLHDAIIKVGISEGDRHYFRNITFSGNTLYSDSVLLGVLGIRRGDVYNRSLLEERLYGGSSGSDVASLYLDRGYLFFQAVPVERWVPPDSIDVEIRVYEGMRAIIKRVNISGNERTMDHVIRRELVSDPGDVFSRSELVLSQRRLMALGYFDPEASRITPEPHPQRGEVDINYHVVERSSDQIELQMGWGPGGLVGSLGLILNNFYLRGITDPKGWRPLPMGGGQRLTLRAQSSFSTYRGINFSFTEPWLGGRKPNSLTLAVYATEFRGGGSATSRQVTYGTAVSGGWRLSFPDNYFTFLATVEYQRILLQNFRLFPELFSTGLLNRITTEFTLQRNSTDNPIFPKEGSDVALTLVLTPPYSLLGLREVVPGASVEEKYRWLEYWKTKLDMKWYAPVGLGGRLVVRLRYSVGLMGAYNRQLGTPPYDRFEVGGDGITNYVIYGKEIVSSRGYDVYGFNARVFEKVTAELRYPLSLSPASTIYVTAFVEGSNAWEEPSRFMPFELRRSVGVGVRLLFPFIGLMGFDFAVGFDKPFAPPANPLGYLSAPWSRVNIVLGFEPY